MERASIRLFARRWHGLPAQVLHHRQIPRRLWAVLWMAEEGEEALFGPVQLAEAAVAGPQAHACQLSQDGRVETLGPLVGACPAQFQEPFQKLGGPPEFASLKGEFRGP